MDVLLPLLRGVLLRLSSALCLLSSTRLSSTSRCSPTRHSHILFNNRLRRNGEGVLQPLTKLMN